MVQGEQHQGTTHIPAVYQQDGLHSFQQWNNKVKKGLRGNQLARIAVLPCQAGENRTTHQSEPLEKSQSQIHPALPFNKAQVIDFTSRAGDESLNQEPSFTIGTQS